VARSWGARQACWRVLCTALDGLADSAGIEDVLEDTAGAAPQVSVELVV
jgi:hypothetical protein